MNLLDHNIPNDQAEQLRRWRIHFKRIGFEVGRPEWDDQQEVLRFLHRAKHTTLFTRDLGFFRARFCHANYCIATLTVPVIETASYIRRLLYHHDFNIRKNRLGRVLKLSTERILAMEMGKPPQIAIRW